MNPKLPHLSIPLRESLNVGQTFVTLNDGAKHGLRGNVDLSFLAATVAKRR